MISSLLRHSLSNISPSSINKALGNTLYDDLTGLQRSDDGQLDLGAVLFTILSFVLAGIFVPIVKVSAATFIAVMFKVLSNFIFGEETMSRLIASEGYIYYAYQLVKHYVGFGPLLTLFSNPFEALIRILSAEAPINS